MKYLLIIMCLLAPVSQALEFGVNLGMTVMHTSSSTYMDYTDGKTIDYNGKKRTFYPRNMWNDGGPTSNRLIGLTMSHGDYEMGVITFRNSFYTAKRPDRSYAVLATVKFRNGDYLSLDPGIMYVTGYRDALVNDDINGNQEKTGRFSPLLNLTMQLDKSFAIVNTLLPSVLITSVKFTF